MRLDDCSFVAVDCETTGFHPNAHHRIIELAIVSLDASCQPAETWCTLLRPDRDLGPTEIHGIRGRDLVDAPSFDEVLGEVLDRVAGRVLVAHNATFDRIFLEYELARAGVEVSELPAVCTMRLAALVGNAPGRLRLTDCCREFGLDEMDEHTALGDAIACAALLAEYLPLVIASGARTLEDLNCGAPPPADAWPASDQRAPCKQRTLRGTSRENQAS